MLSPLVNVYRHVVLVWSVKVAGRVQDDMPVLLLLGSKSIDLNQLEWSDRQRAKVTVDEDTVLHDRVSFIRQLEL